MPTFSKKYRDRYNFLFWLAWILTFVFSFVLIALFWTWILKRLFGTLQGPELTFTWILCVFGSWLILVIPFMRKKEQIWKRLNFDQETAVDLWLRMLGVLMAGWILTSLFWTWVYVGARSPRLGLGNPAPTDQVAWAKAVFSSWAIVLIPFLILAYRKADVLFAKAVIRQTAKTTPFQRTFVPRAERQLAPHFQTYLKSVPETLPQGHVVSVTLKQGRQIPHVFVFKTRDILGIYDQKDMDWKAQDITEMKVMDSHQLPAYEESKWVRLDG